MTDFVPYVVPYTFEDLSWDLTPPENAWVLNGTLDVSGLNAAQHFPNGYVLSGLCLGIVTTGSLLRPYLAGHADGTQNPVGLLRASVPVTHLVGGTNRAKIGVSYLVHGMVSLSKLPYTSGNAALGGFVDAGAQTALKFIYWQA